MGRLVDLEIISVFQHTAARRRLDLAQAKHTGQALFQHTAARRRLEHPPREHIEIDGFNTQPPEGGWACER